MCRRAGVRIAAVDPSASAAGVLRPGDVLVRVGGHAVANDGTVLLGLDDVAAPADGASGSGRGRRGPGGQRLRVLFGHLVSRARVGDVLPVRVVRPVDGEGGGGGGGGEHARLDLYLT